VPGHPVVLGRAYFDTVSEIEGDIGARELLRRIGVVKIECAHLCSPIDIDTPAVVKQYVAAFGSSIRGLTGTPEEIAKVAKEYRVYYAEHPAESGATDYSVDHSSVLYLMDPKGSFLAPVRADQSGAEIAANLKKLTG